MASSTARIPGHKKHRWLFTLVSFGLMLGISGYVVARNWPAGGIPWLAWRAHAVALAAVSAEILTRAFKIKASARRDGFSRVTAPNTARPFCGGASLVAFLHLLPLPVDRRAGGGWCGDAGYWRGFAGEGSTQ